MELIHAKVARVHAEVALRDLGGQFFMASSRLKDGSVRRWNAKLTKGCNRKHPHVTVWDGYAKDYRKLDLSKIDYVSCGNIRISFHDKVWPNW